MQYLHNLNPRKSEDLSTMAAPRGWSCDAWASRCTRHWSILPSGGSSKAKKKKTFCRWATGHLPPRFCGTFQLDSVSTMGSGGSFIFRFSSFNPPLHSLHLQKSSKITNAGGKLQKRQTHGIYVHKTRSSRSKGQDVKTRNFKRDKLILPFRRKYGSDLDRNMALRLSLDMGHEGHKRCGMMWMKVDWMPVANPSVCKLSVCREASISHDGCPGTGLLSIQKCPKGTASISENIERQIWNLYESITIEPFSSLFTWGKMAWRCSHPDRVGSLLQSATMSLYTCRKSFKMLRAKSRYSLEKATLDILTDCPPHHGPCSTDEQYCSAWHTCGLLRVCCLCCWPEGSDSVLFAGNCDSQHDTKWYAKKRSSCKTIRWLRTRNFAASSACSVCSFSPREARESSVDPSARWNVALGACLTQSCDSWSIMMMSWSSLVLSTVYEGLSWKMLEAHWKLWPNLTDSGGLIHHDTPTVPRCSKMFRVPMGKNM